MERNDKILRINNLETESEIHDLLMDLLPKMGYSDVTLTHERGSLPENGKDIVASKFDEEENKKEWYAFVVKKGDVRGTSLGVQEIRAQVNDCFMYAWHSLVKGKNIKINKVKVVVSGKYNSGASEKILADHAFENPNVSLWSGKELVEFIDRYYSRYWLKGSKLYKEYIQLFQERNKEDNLTKAIGLKSEKLKKIVDFAIQPKLIEVNIADNGDIKRRWFETHAIAKLSDSALIVGHSGSGKSTFFKILAKDIIYENSLRNEYELYPIIVKFTDFEMNNFDIELLLSHHLQSADFSSAKLDTVELLAKKNFVLFIDALDEIGSLDLKEKALKAIQDFRLKNPEIKIYCSSRPADYLLSSCQKLKFKYLEITNITQQQTEQFLNRYFNEEEIKCKRLLKSLKDSHILDKLPKTPLTLALIAAIFDESEIEIPATISDLYKLFTELLLNKSLKDSTLDLLKVGIHRSTLANLAEHLHLQRRKQLSKNEAITLIEAFADERGHKYSAAQLFDDLLNHTGLIIENERGEIEFKHLSFQEYFTAYQFYNHNHDQKKNFIENFNDVWWQNVAIFYAGMTKDSPQLMHDILSKSEPKNFFEYITNLSGIGFLMQALYNTPIDARLEGVMRNISNSLKAISFLLTTKEPEYDIMKGMFNTEYGVFKIMSFWYEHHHTSVTLVAPLERAYNDIKEKLLNTSVETRERAYLEYSCYLLASTLAEIDDINLKYLTELLDITDPKNNFVRGLIATNFDDHFKRLTKEERKRRDIQKFRNKVNLLDHEKIQNRVNVRLLDGKKVQPRLDHKKK